VNDHLEGCAQLFAAVEELRLALAPAFLPFLTEPLLVSVAFSPGHSAISSRWRQLRSEAHREAMWHCLSVIDPQ